MRSAGESPASAVEPLERFSRRVVIAARELDLDEQLEQRCAGGGARSHALEAQASAVLGQREVASSQSDHREHAPRGRVPFMVLEQALGLLEAALSQPKVREPHQRQRTLRPVAALERLDHAEQLLLRLGPAADGDQDPSVVEPACRRHEIRPRD